MVQKVYYEKVNNDNLIIINLKEYNYPCLELNNLMANGSFLEKIQNRDLEQLNEVGYYIFDLISLINLKLS